MNTQLPRCSLDRPHPVCVLPSDLLEQFHLRSPVHRPPCRLRRQSSQLVSEGGPNVTSTSGPNQNSEINWSGRIREGHCTGHKAALVSPVEADPRAIGLPLILRVGGLLKSLVMVDPKDARRWWRVEDQTADPWRIEPVARSSQGGHRGKPVEIRHADARRETVDL